SATAAYGSSPSSQVPMSSPRSPTGVPSRPGRSRWGTSNRAVPFWSTTRQVSRSWEATECPSRYCRSAPGETMTASAPARAASSLSRAIRSASVADVAGSRRARSARVLGETAASTDMPGRLVVSGRRVASVLVLQLLDLAGMYFRAFYAVPASITGPHGRPVNAIRGSLDMIAKVVTDAHPDRVIACLDIDWRPAWRVSLIPSYKTHRVAGDAVPGAGGADPRQLTQLSEEEVPDQLSPQVPVLLDVLAAIGVAQAGAPEAEADDVIGTLVERETTEPV